jgi:hypothetical protein
MVGTRDLIHVKLMCLIIDCIFMKYVLGWIEFSKFLGMDEWSMSPF